MESPISGDPIGDSVLVGGIGWPSPNCKNLPVSSEEKRNLGGDVLKIYVTDPIRDHHDRYLQTLFSIYER